MKCFNRDGYGAIVNSSRGIIYAYNHPAWKEKHGLKNWQCAVEEAIIKMDKELKGAIRHVKGHPS
jgi:orotidine-5'-phosphate decarboxylase